MKGFSFAQLTYNHHFKILWDRQCWWLQ